MSFICGSYHGFQSTLPRGERPRVIVPFKSSVVFQSTLPRGERLPIMLVNTLEILFQSTLPRGERLGRVKVCSKYCVYFNPRSHEGSDKRERLNTDEVNQFQSTLPRGERPQLGEYIASTSVFQSTLPRGERHLLHSKSQDHSYFNPRSHEGSDSFATVKAVSLAVFQSTLPRGERPMGNSSLGNTPADFNPRSHEGSDYSNNSIKCISFISIHAPTRGATLLHLSLNH